MDVVKDTQKPTINNENELQENCVINTTNSKGLSYGNPSVSKFL